MEEQSRVGRPEEMVTLVRALLAGERVSHRGCSYAGKSGHHQSVAPGPGEIWPYEIVDVARGESAPVGWLSCERKRRPWKRVAT